MHLKKIVSRTLVSKLSYTVECFYSHEDISIKVLCTWKNGSDKKFEFEFKREVTMIDNKRLFEDIRRSYI